MSAVFKSAAGTCLLAALFGCAEPAPEMREVRISGTATLPDGSVPAGTLHVQAYHAWSGEGILRHPLQEMGGFTTQAADISGTISYPAGGGEGLAVHAWLDQDGDGVFCTPANQAEPSGLVVFDEMPAGEARVSLVLAETCKAANWFYPPGPQQGN